MFGKVKQFFKKHTPLNVHVIKTPEDELTVLNSDGIKPHDLETDNFNNYTMNEPDVNTI